MEIQRPVPPPIDEGPEAPIGSIVFWRNATTTCQLTAVQILDDMVACNFQMDPVPNDIPVPILTWYFWARASVLVQAEHAMSEGAKMRDLAAATTIAQDLSKQLAWLNTCERPDAEEQNVLRVLHTQIVEALRLRPFYTLISDQTYGGNIVEPQRIQAPHRIKLAGG